VTSGRDEVELNEVVMRVILRDCFLFDGGVPDEFWMDIVTA